MIIFFVFILTAVYLLLVLSCWRYWYNEYREYGWQIEDLMIYVFLPTVIGGLVWFLIIGGICGYLE